MRLFFFFLPNSANDMLVKRFLVQSLGSKSVRIRFVDYKKPSLSEKRENASNHIAKTRIGFEVFATVVF